MRTRSRHGIGGAATGKRTGGWGGSLVLVALVAATLGGAPIVAAEGTATMPAGDAGTTNPPRFVLTPEQEEKLRLAREAEVRTALGLAPDAALPAPSELTDAQRATLRAVRDAEMRRVLGLGPSDPIPDRASATPEQRQRIEQAHEARLREALGLAPGDVLPIAPGPDGSLPAAPADPNAKEGGK